ncbi:hypothetical protein A33M_0021 [Rhodovulum sp. PH10]|nr:hypothetical protein A33M_0021 [Rhodovulum sp. PH10]
MGHRGPRWYPLVLDDMRRRRRSRMARPAPDRISHHADHFEAAA